MIYIAGPMSGIEDFNRPAFNAYAKKLKDRGIACFNPAQNGLPPEASWASHMRVDIQWLMSCDEIHLLPGWQESRGARLEHGLAVALGMRVLEVVE
ncbi:MAG: hypothetical protein RL299_797 [Pseudomonadota bacterium]